MGHAYRGPAGLKTRNPRSIAVEKGTEPSGFTEGPPLEQGAGGSVPAAVAGGSYKPTPVPVKPAPLLNPTKSPFKGMK